MEMETHAGREKRNYIRIVYNPGQRPRLNIADNEFAVTDISEGGIRFMNSTAVQLPEFVTGNMTLLNDNMIAVDGKIEWQQDNEAGLSLKYLIPTGIIENEQRHIILNCD